VRRIDKDSDNFGAELLLKELGAVVRQSGTSVGGAAAVRDVLAPLGVTVGTVADGSGLSSRDRQTAAGEMSLLKAAEASGVYAALRAALPIACEDGTLEKRMCGTPAARKAIGKTGTLNDNHSLTGWTTTADGHTVRYAILLTGTTSNAKARAAIDACVVLLSGARVG
jgi:D-alanyl-D-alanine carboxypeptidase/D-alanyl-D-alanine-endopeptidase (penicillin-binding protein 4)